MQGGVICITFCLYIHLYGFVESTSCTTSMVQNLICATYVQPMSLRSRVSPNIFANCVVGYHVSLSVCLYVWVCESYIVHHLMGCACYISHYLDGAQYNVVSLAGLDQKSDWKIIHYSESIVARNLNVQESW